jgi:hypothetical protein
MISSRFLLSSFLSLNVQDEKQSFEIPLIVDDFFSVIPRNNIYTEFTKKNKYNLPWTKEKVTRGLHFLHIQSDRLFDSKQYIKINGS